MTRVSIIQERQKHLTQKAGVAMIVQKKFQAAAFSSYFSASLHVRYKHSEYLISLGQK